MKIEDKLFLDRFKVDEESHLKIIDSQKCMKDCPEQPCLYLCPANVYRLEQDHISVNYEGRFPRGGYGISHKFG